MGNKSNLPADKNNPEEIKKMLLEMGFTEEQISAEIARHKTLEKALDKLLASSGQTDLGGPPRARQVSPALPSGPAMKESASKQQQHRSSVEVHSSKPQRKAHQEEEQKFNPKKSPPKPKPFPSDPALWPSSSAFTPPKPREGPPPINREVTLPSTLAGQPMINEKPKDQDIPPPMPIEPAGKALPCIHAVFTGASSNPFLSSS